VSPQPVVVRDTTPTVTAHVDADGVDAEGGTVTFSSGATVLGTAQVHDGTASLTLPAYQQVGPQTVTVAYGGAPGFAPSSTTVSFEVVKATPTMTVLVQPDVIHKKTTSPVLDVTLSARGQVVTGYVVVRQNGSILGLEQLSGGHASITLPPYKKKAKETVTVEYLGSDLAEAVTQQVTIDVEN
jgi:hypothetical protein